MYLFYLFLLGFMTGSPVANRLYTNPTPNVKSVVIPNGIRVVLHFNDVLRFRTLYPVFPGSAVLSESNRAHAHAADTCNFSATKRAWRATKPRCFIIISDSTYLRARVVTNSQVFRCFRRGKKLRFCSRRRCGFSAVCPTRAVRASRDFYTVCPLPLPVTTPRQETRDRVMIRRVFSPKSETLTRNT